MNYNDSSDSDLDERKVFSDFHDQLFVDDLFKDDERFEFFLETNLREKTLINFSPLKLISQKYDQSKFKI